MKIYNTLTRNKELFRPIDEGRVSMYVCGPTVYGPPHVGHAKSYVFFDVVYRYLIHLGYDVKYVQNITDVGHLVGDSDEGEDKIEKISKTKNISPYEIAYEFETKYFDNMSSLNVKKPTISSRATGVIPEIIENVKMLVDKGFAYSTNEGNVYFDITKAEDYGKLSNRSLDEVVSGSRVNVADDKRNPSDFALWKKAVNGHIMKWNSPWSVGYPGWHIECSTMIRKFLGDRIDIHGGGMDNVFPHHECEIAQSVSLSGNKNFVNYFVHNNLVTVNGQKMGKSLNNFITLDELFKEYDPMIIRFYLLLSHYRKPTDFSKEKIDAAKIKYEEICDIYNELSNYKNNSNEINNDISNNIEMFKEALEDDFNTPLAISYLYEINRIIKQFAIKEDYKYVNQVMEFYRVYVFDVLGLKIMNKNSQSNEQEYVDLLNILRDELRTKKEYGLSDRIRNFLNEHDVKTHDRKI